MSGPRCNMTVLVLDDDPSVRRGLQRFLTSAGCTVKVFETAQDLLLALDEYDSDVCIVADVLMPGVDGFAALAAVRSKRPLLPVILMTAHDSPSVRQQAAEGGAAAFFRKPVDGEQLLETIRRVLDDCEGQV